MSLEHNLERVKKQENMILKERFVRFFKKISNFKVSNLVGDVNQTSDPSITALKHLFMKVYLISISPKAMNGHQPPNHHRLRIARLITWVYYVEVIRSILYFYAKFFVDDYLMLDMLGDFFCSARNRW